MSFRKATPNGRGLGWRPQLKDHRDAAFTYSVAPHVALNLPETVALPQLPVWDQGQLGSCTGHGCGYVVLFDAVKQGLLKRDDVPSRLMIYYLEREREGTVNEDAGAEIRDGIKVLAEHGVCLEVGSDGWPYDVARFRTRPPAPCFASALRFQAVRYRPVPQASVSLRGCLAEGFPIVFGFTCYPELDSTMVAHTGIVPMPGANEAPIGGHCVALDGYDNATRRYRFRNSWGPSWGDHGYGYLPYEYVHRADLASDFWTVRLVG